MQRRDPDQSAAPDDPGQSLTDENRRLRRYVDELRKTVSAQGRELEQLRQTALTDPLTELPNRRAFDRELDQRLGEWQRHQRPFCLMLLDIDSLKTINDQRGHASGDQALRNVAGLLSANTRRTDLVSRIGGDEFAVILPAAAVQQAASAAARILEPASQAPVGPSTTPRLTLSLGLAGTRVDETRDALFGRADAALYAAKQNGGECCYMHDGQQVSRCNAS